MSKIVACYNTFNDANVLEESLRSVIDIVDFVVVVDGAYLGLQDIHDHSYDGTVDMVNELVGKRGMVVQPVHRLAQPQKRDLYLKFARASFPDAWTFVIDSDEILRDAEEDFEWLRGEQGMHYQIAHIHRNDSDRRHWHGYHLHTPIFKRTSFRPRLYHDIPGLHYAENHWALRDAAGDRIELKYRNVRLKKAWLEHKRTSRRRQSLDTLNYYNVYERWKYEKAPRPLKYLIPFPILKAVRNFLYRYDIDPQKYLDYIHGYTLGSRTYD